LVADGLGRFKFGGGGIFDGVGDATASEGGGMVSMRAGADCRTEVMT
jgi:hypothetical protein